MPCLPCPFRLITFMYLLKVYLGKFLHPRDFSVFINGLCSSNSCKWKYCQLQTPSKWMKVIVYKKRGGKNPLKPQNSYWQHKSNFSKTLEVKGAPLTAYSFLPQPPLSCPQLQMCRYAAHGRLRSGPVEVKNPINLQLQLTSL